MTDGCDPAHLNDCIYRQMIYRASLANFILFVIITLLSVSDKLNKNLLPLKFIVGIGLFIAFWWSSNATFSNWAEVSRFFSILWLLVQGLLMLDFAHDVHEVIIAETSTTEENHNRGMYVGYLLLSAASLAAVILGLVYLFQGYTGCDLGLFFTLLTLIVGVVATIISLLDVVSKGMLTPLIMFAYSVFMCWYSLLSNPSTACNPTADSNASGTKTTSIVVVCAITLVAVFYVVACGSIVLNIFNPDGAGVLEAAQQQSAARFQSVITSQPGDPEVVDGTGGKNGKEEDAVDSSGTLHERVLFGLIMTFLSCYGAMILTGWGTSDGRPEATGSQVIAIESMWIKITSQWVFLLMQLKALHVAYTDNASS